MRGVFDVFFFEKMKIRKKYETNIKTSLPLSKKLYFDLKKNEISVNWKKKHLNIFLSYLLKNDISRIIIIFSICSTSSPGGNQVDGLPPALNSNCRSKGSAQIGAIDGFKPKIYNTCPEHKKKWTCNYDRHILKFNIIVVKWILQQENISKSVASTFAIWGVFDDFPIEKMKISKQIIKY